MTDSTLLHDTATRLPAEIRQMVYRQLDFGVAINLSKTCSFFKHEVQPDRCTSASKHAFLGTAERYRRHATKPPFSHFHTAYACHDCHRVLPRDAFTDTALAEDGVTSACRDSPRPADDATVQGPLLAGSRWSRMRASGKVYTQAAELNAWSQRNRRACFECEIKRGGWWPGQPVMFRGQVYLFCAQCQQLKLGPSCLECHTCRSCMDLSITQPAPECPDPAMTTDSQEDPNFARSSTFRTCLHVYVMSNTPSNRDDQRALEILRRGLVHLIAHERTGDPSRFLDLVFDPALDDMPPYSLNPEPAKDMESMRDIGDSITALGPGPEHGHSIAKYNQEGHKETAGDGSVWRWAAEPT